ncbi:protein 4.1-like isoform X9 [Ptychodera flava]|uniref:protein 4.1-like isoform X9 n=1 Tax=Ptychodera flava TaxID=63121 RepID=UPI00396A07CD
MSTEGGPAGDTMETRQQQQSSPSKKSPEHKKAPQRQRMQLCRVLLLDGAEMDCEVEKKSKGQALFDKIAENLNIMEKDYFGITYRDAADQKYWLDPVKDMKKQIRSGAWVFSFNVKFYPPDPAQLQEDITRYYLVLQLRDDILKGKLPCSFVTHALLGSYIVQAEFGDYDPEEHGTDPTYLSDLRFAPNQTRELEEKIMELHKTHKGQTPAEAELHYLENAKKLAMYGVDLHHARDSEGVDIMLGVCANGLLIYRDRLRINRFAWPKILKISYKRNNFYIKIRPGEVFEQFESTIGFKLANHRAAKRLWKVCVEHHTFFRLVQPEPPPKGKLFHLGSKFRYSGRTQFQTRQTNALIDRPAPQFERIASKRFHSLDGGYGAPRDQNRPDESKLGQVEPPVVDEAAPPPSERVPYLDSERPAEPEEGRSVPCADSEDEEEEAGRSRPGEDDEEDKEDDGSPRKWGTAYETTTVTTTVTRSTEGHTVEGEPDQEPQPLEDESPKGERIDEHPEWGIGVTRYIGGDTYPYDKQDKEDEGAVVVPDDDVPEDSDRIPEGYHVTKTYTTEEVPEYVEGEPGTHIIVTKKTTVVTSVSGTDDPDQVDYVQPVPQQPDDEQKEEDVVEEVEEEPEEVAPVDEPVQADAEDEEMVATPSFDVAPVVKTAALKYQPGEDDDTTATTDVPIVHTESKTITYESNETNEEPEPIDPGQLQSAQTITSETHTTTTTTHITKTVKGGVSETRVEKKIVIQGDANIDHDQALADAIKEATALNPDMTVTKVVVHKEGDEVVEEVSQDHVQENGEN